MPSQSRRSSSQRAPDSQRKLKQACLPFKVLDKKPTKAAASPASGAARNKKRKSEVTLSQTKAPKAAKTDKSDSVAAAAILQDEHEVSSSSEPDSCDKSKANHKSTLLDKFISGAQQPEVTTSGVEDAILIEDDDDDVESNKENTLVSSQTELSKELSKTSTETVTSDNAASSCGTNNDSSNQEEKDEPKAAKDELMECVSGKVKSTSCAPDSLSSVAIVDSGVPTNDNRVDVSLKEAECTNKATVDGITTNVTTSEADSESLSKVDAKVTDSQEPEYLAVNLETKSHSKQSSSIDNEDAGDENKESTTKQSPAPAKPTNTKLRARPVSQAKESLKKQKETEKERLRLEKLKLKEEEKRQKEEQRRMKEEQKRAEREKKEQERSEAKQQREQERKEKLQEKERERQEREKQKEEERKKKQEIIDAKNEQKRKRDEERRLKEEEKLKLEEQKNKAKEKTQSFFQSFFTKTEKTPKPEKVQNNGPFQQFSVRSDMKLAPVSCVDASESAKKRDNIDKHLPVQNCKSLYLDELRRGAICKGKRGKTWPRDEESNEVICLDETHSIQRWMRVKLLKFSENNRPAYYGTWRKHSKHIRPRAPLGTDKDLLDYEYDSDDDWVEEEPGESLSASEGEDDGADDEDADDDDGFFVPHAYLSDEEMDNDDEEEITPEIKKAMQMAKIRAFEERQKQQVMAKKVVNVGLCWAETIEEHKNQDPLIEKLDKLKGELLFDCTWGIPVGDAVYSGSGASTVDLMSPSDTNSAKSAAGASAKKTARKTTSFPTDTEAVTDLIRLVHGCGHSVAKLIHEFREFWHRKTNPEAPSDSQSDSATLDTSIDMKQGDTKPSKSPAAATHTNTTPTRSTTPGGVSPSPSDTSGKISKRQLDLKIRSIAEYRSAAPGSKMRCWCVHQKILDEHNLSDLPIPNTGWKWTTQHKKQADSGSKKSSQQAKDGNATTLQSKAASKSAGDITQFTVAGFVPPMAESTPKNSGKNTPSNNSKSSSKKRRAESPLAAFLTPKTKQAAGTPMNTSKDTASNTNSTPTNSNKNITPPRRSQLKSLTPVSLFMKKSARSANEPPPKTEDCIMIDDDSNEEDTDNPNKVDSTDNKPDDKDKQNDDKSKLDSNHECMIID